MKSLLLTLLAVLVLVLWIKTDCDKYETLAQVPVEFRGVFRQAFYSQPGDLADSEQGPELFVIGEQSVSTSHPDGEDAARSYPIRIVHRLKGGSIVLFYGAVDSDHIAKFRRKLILTETGWLLVHDIVDDGIGNDTLFRVGEYRPQEMP